MTMNTQAEGEGPAFEAAPEPTRQVYTVNEFCKAYAVPRVTLFGLWREGRGPKFMKVGPRTGTILIPVAEAQEWMNRLVEETQRNDWRRHAAVVEAKEAREAAAALAQAYEHDPAYRMRVN